MWISSRGKKLTSPATLVILALALFFTRQALAGQSSDAHGLDLLCWRAAVRLLDRPDAALPLGFRIFVAFLAPLVALAALLTRGALVPIGAAVALALAARGAAEMPPCALMLIIGALAVALTARDGRALWASLLSGRAGTVERDLQATYALISGEAGLRNGRPCVRLTRAPPFTTRGPARRVRARIWRFIVMHRRDLASVAALASLALTIGVGCPEEPKPAVKTTAAPAKTVEVKKDEPKKDDAKGGGSDGKMGTATIKGVVNFTGKAPEMKVPKKRKDAEVCKAKDVKYNAVVTAGGKLADVLVRITNDGVKGDYKAPSMHAEIDQIDCMYSPRILGMVAGQTLDIKNGDATLHNVNSYKGSETMFNTPQPKGSDPLAKPMPDEAKIVKLTCDVHPWMRAFVIVTGHPFFSVSGADGAFSIEKVPAGDYTVEAWHSHYGLKTAKLKVEDGKPAEVTFSYDGTEAEPAENKDELKDLF